MKFGRKDYDIGKSIPAEEPAFLLRAQDKFAADTIRFYANLIASNGATTDVVASARAQADEFDRWPTKQVPDINKPAPVAVPDALKPALK